MASSVLISEPFAKPDTPPPPVVVILNATEFHFKPPVSLLAFEDLHQASYRGSTTRTSSRYHPYNHKEAITPPSDRQSTSRSTPPAELQRPTIPPTISPADLPGTEDPLDMSPLSSPEPSRPSSPVPASSGCTPFGVSATKIKIERPKGASRKNFQDQVKWDPAFLADVKKHTRQLVRAHLDDALCFKDQEKVKLDVVRKMMVEKFPRLDDYDHHWPLDIIIMGLLKYSSSHGKGISHKNAVDAVRDFVGPTVPNSQRPRRLVAK